MKKIAVLVALALLMMATVALAGKHSVSATYWRVTDILETRTADGMLIGRELELSCEGKKKYIDYSANDPVWPEVKKIEVQDWLWLNTGPGKKVKVFFGYHPPAQMELGNILK